MSLVTRCPACSTAFKVVRDQLRISEGWVRCGRCSQVFDATLDLQNSEDGEPHAPMAAPTESGATATTPEAHLVADKPALPASTDEAGTATLTDDDDDFVEPDSWPMGAAPAAPWPARDLLDLRPSAAPVASPPARLPAEPEASDEREVSNSLSSTSPEQTAPAVPVSGWPPLPNDLPAIVADEPWPLTAASRPSQDDAGAPPSLVDEAVNAQLQKALRRTRIQALRESRARARAEAAAQAQDASDAACQAVDGAAPPALVPATGAPAVATEVPMSLQEAATLRQASEETPTTEKTAATATAPASASALPSFLDAGLPVETPRAPHRVALLTLAVLAALLLMFQVLRHERDALAAAQPGARPLLAVLCQLSACELSPVRRIDAIRIDGSSFTPGRESGSYSLLFSLRNASPTALAMPAIELSLLDGNERPVVRRVFQPTEFGAPPVLGARAEQAATLALTLKLPEGGGVPPVVGYSLLAFYP